MALLVSLFVPGCLAYHDAPLDLEQAAGRFEQRRLDDPALRAALAQDPPAETPAAPATRPAATAPATAWDLDRLSRAALLYHPDLALARAHLATVEASRLTAAESPNPSVGFAPSYATKAAGANPWTLGWTFDIPIETANKRGIRIAQAAALSDAARAELAQSAWTVRSTLRETLAEYLLDTDEAGLYAREVEHRKQYADALAVRLRAGEASAPDLATATLDLLSARQEWRSAEGRITDARARLAAAIGLPVAGLGDAAFQWPEIAQLPPLSVDEQTALRTAALLNRLDVHRALLEYAAADRALELEIARQYPDLHISPGYTFDQGQNKWELGATVELPVFNQNRGAISEAHARRKELSLKVETLQSQAIAQLESATARYTAAQVQLADAAAQLAAIDQQVAAAESALRAGEQDRPSVLALQVQQDVSRRLRLDAVRKARVARGLLEDAIQRPLDPMRTPSS